MTPKKDPVDKMLRNYYASREPKREELGLFPNIYASLPEEPPIQSCFYSSVSMRNEQPGHEFLLESSNASFSQFPDEEEVLKKMKKWAKKPERK
jgi:hypothetical protein